MTPLTWELLERVFTAETVMTPRKEMLTWERGGDLSTLRSEAKQRRFDLIPVTEHSRIVDVLCVDAEAPEPIIDQWLVSRDTGIPDLLALFAQSGRPGFLVFHRQDVIGLVTPADLNKLPARVYFYNLIGELELALAGCIRNHFVGDPGGLIQTLGEKRQQNLDDQVGKLIEGHADVDPVQLLCLSDLVNIVAKREELRVELGFSSRRAAESVLNGLVCLRNDTMHPVRPLLERIPEDVQKLHARVEQARDVLRRLKPSS